MRNYADLVGYAYSCERYGAWAEAEVKKANDEAKRNGSGTESIVFISGNCHYHGGPLLWISEITVDEKSPTRLFGPAAARFGDLTPMPARAPHAAEIVKTIGPMFELIRAQDHPGFEAYLKSVGAVAPEYHANDALGPGNKPFYDLRGTTALPAVQYFIPKERSRRSDYVAVGCVCRAGDCDGKWPIATVDTGGNEWPYACITATKEGKELYLQWR
jgi:hypothetical protein